jgi:hypothetical protein
LLTAGDFAELAGVPSLGEFEQALQRKGYAVGGSAALERPGRLELAIRRRAAARMATVARWCGRRTRTLAVLFENEDRRSLRALLRGAVHSVGMDERLSGLIPTPNLPEGALAELAAKDSARGVAGVLAAWGNPYGPVLLPEAARQRPDMWRLEAALNREFGRRAVLMAPRGGPHLVAFARQVIDVENGFSALQRGPPEEFDDILGKIIKAFEGSPLAESFRRHGHHGGRLESAVLMAQIAEQVMAARRQPLGVAPVIAFALRVRGEVVDLQRIVWGLRLGSPQEVLVAEFSAVA